MTSVAFNTFKKSMSGFLVEKFKKSPFSLLHAPKHANNFSEILFQLSARFAAIKANGRRGKTRAD